MKKLYYVPQAESVKVKVDANFCESLYNGVELEEYEIIEGL